MHLCKALAFLPSPHRSHLLTHIPIMKLLFIILTSLIVAELGPTVYKSLTMVWDHEMIIRPVQALSAMVFIEYAKDGDYDTQRSGSENPKRRNT